MQASLARICCEIDRALAKRRLEAHERFARAQIARLAKALRLAEAAIELGELKAVAIYLRIVAMLEVAAGGPPPVRPTKGLSRALSTEALAVPAPHANDDAAAKKAPAAAEKIQQ